MDSSGGVTSPLGIRVQARTLGLLPVRAEAVLLSQTHSALIAFFWLYISFSLGCLVASFKLEKGL